MTGGKRRKKPSMESFELKVQLVAHPVGLLIQVSVVPWHVEITVHYLILLEARSRKFWKAANIFEVIVVKLTAMGGNGCHKKTAQRAAKVPNLPPPDYWINAIIPRYRAIIYCFRAVSSNIFIWLGIISK